MSAGCVCKGDLALGSGCGSCSRCCDQLKGRIAELEAALKSMAQGVKISVPTATMEQEFATHYRRGFEAGKKEGEAALAKAQEDGRRYRYVRATTKAIRSDDGSQRIECTPEEFDAAIDAALR